MRSPYRYNDLVKEHFEGMSERIRQAVSDSGIAGYQFANICEITPSAACHFLAGRRKINRDINILVRLSAQVLHSTVHKMLFGRDEEIEAPTLLTRFLYHVASRAPDELVAIGDTMEQMEHLEDRAPSQWIALRLQEFAEDRLCKNILAAGQYDKYRLIVSKPWFSEMAHKRDFAVSGQQMIAICLSFGLNADLLTKKDYIRANNVYYFDQGKNNIYRKKYCPTPSCLSVLPPKRSSR